MLVDVPTNTAKNPKHAMNIFFMTINDRDTPHVSRQKTQVSIRAGNMRPRVDKHKAPTKDMNKSNLGIATASKTVEKKTNGEFHKNNCFENICKRILWFDIKVRSFVFDDLHVIRQMTVRTTYSQNNL